MGIRIMTHVDIPQVVALEKQAFAAEGMTTPFARELENRVAAYLVACTGEGAERPARVVGYAGLWFVVDEAHLTSIAVLEDRRRQGIGLKLLRASMLLALERQATMMTLEVRASNAAAQALYQAFGFRKVGVRRGYYTDNREDAYLMTVEGIDSPQYRAQLGRWEGS